MVEVSLPNKYLYHKTSTIIIVVIFHHSQITKKNLGQVIIEFEKSDSCCVTKLVDIFRAWISMYFLLRVFSFEQKIEKTEKEIH